MSIGRNNNIYSSTMLDLINNIVEVVVNSYFYWVDDYQFREDLMQEGYLKAYELLKTGNYDPNQNLRNYLYTGVRNAMTNLNYHNNKEKHFSYDFYEDNINTEEFDQNYTLASPSFSSYEIDIDEIVKACNKYDFKYVGNIVDYFRSIGIECPKIDVHMKSPSSIIMKAIVVDIIWNI